MAPWLTRFVLDETWGLGGNSAVDLAGWGVVPGCEDIGAGNVRDCPAGISIAGAALLATSLGPRFSSDGVSAEFWARGCAGWTLGPASKSVVDGLLDGAPRALRTSSWWRREACPPRWFDVLECPVKSRYTTPRLAKETPNQAPAEDPRTNKIVVTSMLLRRLLGL